MSTFSECKAAEAKASGINSADWRRCAQLWRECRSNNHDDEACDFIAESIERGDRERMKYCEDVRAGRDLPQPKGVID